MENPMVSVALLIDGDNFPPQYVPDIIEYCTKHYATVVIMRAYGDWEKPNLKKHAATLKELGVDLVQQDRNAKNATDHALVIDAIKILCQQSIQVFVIASTDADFSVLCQQIRKDKRYVMVVSQKRTAIKNFCDEQITIEQLKQK